MEQCIDRMKYCVYIVYIVFIEKKIKKKTRINVIVKPQDPPHPGVEGLG